MFPIGGLSMTTMQLGLTYAMAPSIAQEPLMDLPAFFSQYPLIAYRTSEKFRLGLIRQVLHDTNEGALPLFWLNALLRPLILPPPARPPIILFGKLVTSGQENVIAGGEISADEGLMMRPATIPEILGPDIANVQDYSNLTAMCIMDPEISNRTRHSDALQVFFNGIPSIELSQCVPFMKVTLMSGRPGIVNGVRVAGTSLVRFLEGSALALPGTPDYAMAGGALNPVALGANAVISATFGTSPSSLPGAKAIVGNELFTTPQTLVRSGIDLPGLDMFTRSVPLKGENRPFLSVDSLNIDVVGLRSGYLNRLEGTLNLVLHDRARMNEISDLIKPGTHHNSELFIEWGWQHPQGNLLTDNVVGQFMNNMRNRYKFRVINASYNFDDVGQVNINLRIVMSGGDAMEELRIFDDQGSSAVKKVAELGRTISTISRDLKSLVTSEGAFEDLKDVVGHQFLYAPTDTTRVPDTSVVDGVIAALSADKTDLISRNIDVVQLTTALNQLYLGGDLADVTPGQGYDEFEDGTPGLTTARLSVAQMARRKLYGLRNINLKDPFLSLVGQGTVERVTVGGSTEAITIPTPAGVGPSSASSPTVTATAGSTTFTEGRRFSKVSLGKLLLDFVGKPLAKSKRYDEVQLFFYPFNSEAGLMGKIAATAGTTTAGNPALRGVGREGPTADTDARNVAEFEIDLDSLEEVLTNVALRKGSLNMTLTEFMSEVISRFTDNTQNPNYGITSLANQTHIYEDGKVAVKSNDAAEAMENKSLSDQTILDDISPTGTFRKPQLEVSVEARSMLPPVAGLPVDPLKEITILRIHVYDAVDSPFKLESDLLEHSNPELLRPIANMGLKTSQKFTMAVTAGIIRPLVPTGVDTRHLEAAYKVTTRVDKLKKYVQGSMPSIVFGIQNSMIKSLQVRTMHDPLIATANLMDSKGLDSHLSPLGTEVNGMPALMYPAQIEMTIVGCPIVDFGQHVFVDMGTGTTIDNIYAITGISHTVSQGSYETRLTMWPLSGYQSFTSLTTAFSQAIKNIGNAPIP